MWASYLLGNITFNKVIFFSQIVRFDSQKVIYFFIFVDILILNPYLRTQTTWRFGISVTCDISFYKIVTWDIVNYYLLFDVFLLLTEQLLPINM